MNIFSKSCCLFVIGFSMNICKIYGQVAISPRLTVSHVTDGTDSETEKWYEYNTNGDLVRQALSIDTIVFEYKKQKIIKRHIDNTLNWLSTVIYTTDVNGRVISNQAFDQYDKEVSKCKFEYNSDGFLSMTILNLPNSSVSYIQEFVYQAGNLKEIIIYDLNGKYSSKYAFEYYLDMPNVFNLAVHHILDDILPNDRLGKMNKNMLKKLTNISKDGETLSLLNYRYDPLSKRKLKEYLSDVLNEFDTEVIYHFNNN